MSKDYSLVKRPKITPKQTLDFNSNKPVDSVTRILKTHKLTFEKLKNL